ncbi:MAG: 1-phosphatidylinositol-4-phosphate 5-kinase [Amphiamblys sp. WSBS2006]|nr:MAG: 1-phosphatidylinositol-4-phosphate 5-kinase [Amphiamblys sp. WSBS2006]
MATDDEAKQAKTWDARRIAKKRQDGKPKTLTLGRGDLGSDSATLTGGETRSTGSEVSFNKVLLGVKLAVQRVKQNKPVDRKDFEEQKRIFFGEQGKETGYRRGVSAEFKDYFPQVFHRLRACFGISDRRYLDSLGQAEMPLDLGQLGKSGSSIYYTHDIFLVIKMITRQEARFLKNSIRKYFEYTDSNPQTLIAGILGFHRLRTYAPHRRGYFVIIRNIFYPGEELHCSTCADISQVYDIKGATFGREEAEEGKIRKDSNWLKDNTRIHVDSGECVAQLEKDAAFLAALGAMDYSLLVGIAHCVSPAPQPDLRHRLPALSPPGRVYYLGIVDILTQYRPAKRIEALFKCLFLPGESVSAVHPRTYMARFSVFLRSSVFVLPYKQTHSARVTL